VTRELYSRLKGAMLLRVVIVTFLLGLAVTFQAREAESIFSIPLYPLYILIGISYFLTLVYALIIERLKEHRLFGYIQLSGDVLFITAIVYFTGGIESPFGFLYPLVIIGSAILLYRRGALFIASLSGICYGLLLDLDFYGILRLGRWSATAAHSANEVFLSILANIAAFFMVALFSGYLVEKLRKTGEELKEKKIDYSRLEAINRKIVDNVESGLVALNQGGKIISFNKAAEEITGYSIEEVYDEYITSVFAEIGAFLDPMHVFPGHYLRRQQIGFTRKDGKRLILGFSISNLRDEGEKEIGKIVIFQNLTPFSEEEQIFPEFIGSHPSMKEVYRLIQQVKDSMTTILILGESGTGKELVARAIHYNSPRKDKPFVPINLSAIPETLIESELFGHKKGSFTGAIADKKGLLEAAHGGTVFLDEIGELPSSIQVKLLRVIQEKSFKMVGDTHDIRVDLRIISASNRDLEKDVREGKFREDLFYRLNVITIALPPLRERREDIPFLARHFLAKFSKETGKEIRKISREALEILKGYSYPGNVRELENIMERAVALEKTGTIQAQSIPSSLNSPTETSSFLKPELSSLNGLNLDSFIKDIEKILVNQALKKAGGNKTETAKLLGISFRSLRYRMDRLGLK